MNDRTYDTDLLDALSKRVVVGDGAMGTQLQAADLTLDDFNDLEGCNEILNETRPDVIETIHRNYFDNRRRRGRDAIRSAAIWLTLATTTLPTRSVSLSLRGTAIAKRVGSSARWASRRRVTT